MEEIDGNIKLRSFIFSFFITAIPIYTEVSGFLQAIVGGLSGLQIGMLQCPGK